MPLADDAHFPLGKSSLAASLYSAKRLYNKIGNMSTTDFTMVQSAFKTLYVGME
jgi:hypothetical protein